MKKIALGLLISISLFHCAPINNQPKPTDKNTLHLDGEEEVTCMRSSCKENGTLVLANEGKKKRKECQPTQDPNDLDKYIDNVEQKSADGTPVVLGKTITDGVCKEIGEQNKEKQRSN